MNRAQVKNLEKIKSNYDHPTDEKCHFLLPTPYYVAIRGNSRYATPLGGGEGVYIDLVWSCLTHIEGHAAEERYERGGGLKAAKLALCTG